MEKPPHNSLVLVTGGSGFIGSWLVLRLLEKGYRVRATVRDLDDKKNLEPLLALASSFAGERLEIVKGDLRVEGDFDKAAQGCDGVFHLACPVILAVPDPQKDVIDPAVQGTLNVMNACAKASSVKRVIHMSSLGAVRRTGKEPEPVVDESSFTDVDFCVRTQFQGWPYYVGKTLGEKTATEFGKKHNLDVIVVNPSIVMGSFLISKIPFSLEEFVLPLIRGEMEKLAFMVAKPYVHLDDVVQASIFLYENPKASGRFICSAVDAYITEVAQIVHRRYPEFNVPTDLDYLGRPLLEHIDSSKLKRLGFQFKYSLEDIFCDAIDCCKEKGLLKSLESRPH